VNRPLALVYRGEAARPSECSEALAELLVSSPHRFQVEYVGPREKLPLHERVLRDAAVYVQPGGGELGPAYRRMRRYSTAIRRYVGCGGRYLGVCLGGYLAGASPGFHLIPGDADQYITSSGATVHTESDIVVPVTWRGRTRYVYFQDGPVFRMDRTATRVHVLARYDNGEIAAVVTPFRAGRVGVVGVHLEADESWYVDAALYDPDGLDTDLGHDLIEEIMR
jgi:glutamine amidotransferase-like uncharacterized protein